MWRYNRACPLRVKHKRILRPFAVLSFPHPLNGRVQKSKKAQQSKPDYIPCDFTTPQTIMSRTLFFASLMLAVLLATTSSFAQNLPGPFKERINLCNDPAGAYESTCPVLACFCSRPLSCVSPIVSSHPLTDLIIVWDGSSSISPEEYQDEVNFVGDLISELNIAERYVFALFVLSSNCRWRSVHGLVCVLHVACGRRKAATMAITPLPTPVILVFASRTDSSPL